MHRLRCLLLFIAVISPPTISFHPQAQDAPDGPTPAASNQTFGVQQLEEQLEGPLNVEDIAATSTWINSTGIVDWLGPLAPLALSPFFGVTCLSGLSLWGPDWATNNAVLGSTGPLRNETLFFIFLGLTVLTSVPRLTKVSKPFAQAVDRLETYAVIVILLIIKIMASAETSTGEEQIAMVQLGVVSFTLDTLLAIAMVINILVINSVKFFFEFMVWLTPVPFLDAVFEVCNKSLCALLMAIYAMSPTLATVINLFMLLFAAIVLRWISRRVRFYRTMVLDPIVSRLWSGFGRPKRPELIVFPKQEFGPFAAKSRLRLRRADDGEGWTLQEVNWLMPCKEHLWSTEQIPKIRRGWVMHAVEVDDTDGLQTLFSFSRRYEAETLEQLIEELGMRMSDERARESQDELSYEFA